MSKLTIKEVDRLTARTEFEKQVKKALIQILKNEEKTGTDFETPDSIDINEDNVESNLKKDLVSFCDFHDLEVSEPKNKDQYVEAVKNYLAE